MEEHTNCLSNTTWPALKYICTSNIIWTEQVVCVLICVCVYTHLCEEKNGINFNKTKVECTGRGGGSDATLHSSFGYERTWVYSYSLREGCFLS